MTSLTLSIATEDAEFEYNLHSTQLAPSEPQYTLHFFSDVAVSAGNSEVYRGKLSRKGNPEVQDIVCKLAEGDTSSLLSEAKLYDTVLMPLQGEDVPRCLGLFSGTSSLTRKPIACLLFEYCGEPLGGFFIDHPMDVKATAMDILLRLHSLGLIHDDWGPHNILMDDKGRVRVIDFGHALFHPDGQCPLSRNIILYELEPPESEIECQEVYNAALEMEIFTPVHVSYMGFRVDLRYVRSVQHLVEMGKRRCPYRSEKDLREEAIRLLSQWRKSFEHRLIRTPGEDLTQDQASPEGTPKGRKLSPFSVRERSIA